MLDISLDEIFAFEEELDSGKVVAINVTLNDGSHRRYQGEELNEVLLLLEELRFPKPTLPSKAAPSSPKQDGAFKFKKQ